MSTKNDKWVMFRNYMTNELHITKEDIQDWIKEAVQEEARKMVKNSFDKFSPEEMIKRAVYNDSYFGGRAFNGAVIEAAAKIIAGQIEINLKK